MAYMDNESEKIAKRTTGEDAPVDQAEVDKRSVYVGNVDYGATPEELQEHFKSCGPINRITIMVDKYTCCSKGKTFIYFCY